MKKHLVAAAVAAAVAVPAMAQNVTIFGIMDVGYTSADNQRTGTGWAAANGPGERDLTDTGNGEGALSTSRLGFRGTEDLGGGMKANFYLEYGLADAANGGLLTGARESWVGLESSMGSLKLGRTTTAIHGVIAGFSTGAANNTAGALYTSSGNNRPDAIRPHQVYQDNLIQVISPNMNGFTVTAEIGKQDDELQLTAGGRTPTEATTSGLSLRYSGGPLSLGAAFQRRESSSVPGANLMDEAINTFGGINAGSVLAAVATTDGNLGAAGVVLEQEAKTQAYGVSYNLGMVTPFVLHTRNELSTDVAAAGTIVELADSKATEIGVRMPFGATNFWVSMYDGNTDFQQTGDKVDLKGFQLGAAYSMSKRTTLYSIVGRAEQSYNGNGTPANAMDSETDMVAIGLRHSF